MKRRVLSMVLLVAMMVSVVNGSVVAEIIYSSQYVFPDIAWYEMDNFGNMVEHKYYVREITQAYNIGFIDGYEDGTFKPLNSISREEFVKMLMVLATNWTFDFAGVDTKYPATWWAGPYVTIAEMQGVVDKGKWTQEEWKKPITRLEMVLMLAKTQIYMKGIPQNQEGQLKYKDIKGLTQEEKDLLLHAVKYDLLEGMKDGTSAYFEPKALLTRGEAAAALMRVY